MKQPINKPKNDAAKLYRIRFNFAPGSEYVWAADEHIALSIARRKFGKDCYVQPRAVPASRDTEPYRGACPHTTANMACQQCRNAHGADYDQRAEAQLMVARSIARGVLNAIKR